MKCLVNWFPFRIHVLSRNTQPYRKNFSDLACLPALSCIWSTCSSAVTFLTPYIVLVHQGRVCTSILSSEKGFGNMVVPSRVSNPQQHDCWVVLQNNHVPVSVRTCAQVTSCTLYSSVLYGGSLRLAWFMRACDMEKGVLYSGTYWVPRGSRRTLTGIDSCPCIYTSCRLLGFGEGKIFLLFLETNLCR